MRAEEASLSRGVLTVTPTDQCLATVSELLGKSISSIRDVSGEDLVTTWARSQIDYAEG